MSPNALMMNKNDNVVVCTKGLNAGDEVCFKMDGEWVTFEVKEAIPVWNKVAVKDIACGADILKYGEVIGQSEKEILKGECVSHLNIMSMPRNYEDEIIK